MRALPHVGAAAVAAAAATMLLAPAASAHNAPGDNGTVKIHDAKTGEELVKNEPHVCTFYLDAFFFDGQQKADWWIYQQPPTGRALAKSGELTPDASGHGRTADLTLPDGHYKLEWTFDGEHGKAKHKAFWADCPATGTTSGGTTGGDTAGTTGGTTGGDTAGTTGGTTGGDTAGTTGGSTGGDTAGTTGGTTGGTTTGSTTGTPSSSPSSSPATTPTPAATNGGSDNGSSNGGSLASTGASVIGVSGAAAVLLAVGAAFRFRRRGSRH